MATKKKIQQQLTLFNERKDLELENFIFRLERISNRAIDKVLRRLGNLSERSRVEAAIQLGKFADILEEEGLSDEVDRIEKLFALELENVANKFEVTKAGNLFSDIDREAVEALLEYKIDDIAGSITGYGDSLRSEILSTYLTGGEINAEALWLAKGEGTLANVETDIRTALSGLSGSLTAKKSAELGINKWRYIGPLDQVTRKFCENVLAENKIWTRPEIDALNSDPEASELDVFTYKGGYNCRHEWIPEIDIPGEE